MMDRKKIADLLRRVADACEMKRSAILRYELSKEARAAADELERKPRGSGWTWTKTRREGVTTWTGKHPHRPGARPQIVYRDHYADYRVCVGFASYDGSDEAKNARYERLEVAKNVIRDFFHTPRFQSHT